MFNDRLAKVLKAKNISQARLAEAVGCSRQNINDWLAGKTSPKFDKLVKLACFLNVTLEELLEDEAKILGLNLPEYRKAESINSDEQELLNIFRSLNIFDRLRLLTFAFELCGIAVETPNSSTESSLDWGKTKLKTIYTLKPGEEKTKL